MRVNDQVEAIFDKINDMLRTKDFSDLDMVLEMRDKLFDTIVEAIKSQLRRINGDETVSTGSGNTVRQCAAASGNRPPYCVSAWYP